MKKCRTPKLGGKVLICPECGTKVIQYNPCNKRGCPICYKKNQIQWLHRAKKRILQTRHYHLTFSIPGYYTQMWQENKKRVAESLFRAAQATVKDLQKSEEILLGSVLAFQSHGIGLSYKPHIHCLLSEGGLSPNGQYRVLHLLRTKRMEEVFRYEFEYSLNPSTLFRSDYVRESGKLDGYKIYVGIHQENGDAILGYLAKTRNGVVVDVENDLEEKGEEIWIRNLGANGDRQICLNKKVFIDRYVNHIPPDRMVTTRYYGLYSNRHKEDLEKARAQVPTIKVEEDVESRKELCPVCKNELLIWLVFKKDETDILLRMCRVHDPPRHGEVILIA